MRRAIGTRRAAGLLVVGATVAGGLLGGGGCLQILGDDRTFVLGGAGAGGGTTTSGGTGGVGGTGGTGGMMTTDTCTPDEKRACYSGAQGTEGVGNCKAGEQTCEEDGLGWGACQGEVTPTAEDPKVVGDEACDGYASGEEVWSGVYGGLDLQTAFDLAFDPTTDNLLVVGAYDGSLKLDGITLDPPAQAGLVYPGFLAKFRSNGGVESGDGPIATLTGILVTPTGETVVAGFSDGLNPLAGQTIGGHFIAKLTKEGQLSWVRSRQSNITVGMRMAFALDGNVLVLGSFTGTVDWSDNGSLLTSKGTDDVFLLKLDIASGNLLWAQQLGESNDDLASAVAVDPAGNIFVGMNFDGSFTHVPGKSVTSDGAGDSGMVAKLSPDGNAEWAVALQGTQNQVVHALAIGPGGEVFVTGKFDGTMELKDPANTITALPGTGSNDLFVMRLTANGQFAWAHALGATDGIITGLAVGQDGDVFCAGMFGGTADLGGGALATNVTMDGFVGRLSGSGTHLWSKDFGSVTGYNLLALKLGEKTLALATSANGSLNFGAGPLLTVETDVVVAVLGR